MDFKSWGNDNAIDEEVISTMIQKHMDELQVLKQCPIEDLVKELALTLEHQTQVVRALEKLQNQCYEDDQESWASLHNLQPGTVLKLKEAGFTNVNKLISASDNDIKRLEISYIQLNRVKTAIEKIKETEFRRFLDQINLHASTKDKLWKCGFNHVEAFINLRNEDFDFMKLSENERPILASEVELLKNAYRDQSRIGRGGSRDTRKNPQSAYGTEVAGRKKEGWWSLIKHYRDCAVANIERYLTEKRVHTQPRNIQYMNGMRIMKLPVEKVYADNENKVRRCTIGCAIEQDEQKTILMVGGTGVGKSTLIDGLVNNMFGTNWDEIHRLTIIDRCKDEMANYYTGQCKSQTEWITRYTITCGKTSSIPFTLNIIDTPGFGSTEGIRRDQKIVEQIEALFTIKGEEGLNTIDAICFVVKGSDSRITTVQKYIFDSVLSIFGKDIVDNIVIMVTFADGSVNVDEILEPDVPRKTTFMFNNKALFDNNGISGYPVADVLSVDLSKNFWNMSFKSYSAFFNFLSKTTSQDLTMTKKVLENVHFLRESLKTLERRVRYGLSLLSSLNDEKEILKQHETDIENNFNFEYTVQEPYQYREKLPEGEKSNYCHTCDVTCHDKCKCYGMFTKYMCHVFSYGGSCRRCKKECSFTQHEIVNFCVKQGYQRVKKSLAGQLDKYKDDKRSICTIKQEEYTRHQDDVEKDIIRCRKTYNELELIALKINLVSEAEYIDELIKKEEAEKGPGSVQRIDELKKLKATPDTMEKVKKDVQLLPEAGTSVKIDRP